MELFGLLNLGTRSLQAQRAGVEIAGQNLANVNNPAYARQRVVLQTTPTVNTPLGPQGTGVEAVAIRQLRSNLLDHQINDERSAGGYLAAQQESLEYAQASLGEIADLTTEGGTRTGLSADFNQLFAAFQSVSAAPSSLTERQLLVSKAENLASHLNQVDSRLAALHTSLDDSLSADLGQANELLASVASLNERIGHAENYGNGTANDLRDLRQAKLEELSKLVAIDVNPSAEGGFAVSIDGTLVVSGKGQLDHLEVYTDSDGRTLVRTAAGQEALNLSGGHAGGIIATRDGALQDLRSQLNTVTKTLVDETNSVFSQGYGLDGSTGAPLFMGTDAATVRINPDLKEDPSRLQISGVNGSAGDNSVAVALAKLADKKFASLNNQTLSGRYHGIVSQLGESLASITSRREDQQVVEKMLLNQRDSVSGVSIDEEMSDLMKFQKAFEASARLISTIDEMLDTVLSLKR